MSIPEALFYRESLLIFRKSRVLFLKIHTVGIVEQLAPKVTKEGVYD